MSTPPNLPTALTNAVILAFLAFMAWLLFTQPPWWTR